MPYKNIKTQSNSPNKNQSIRKYLSRTDAVILWNTTIDQQENVGGNEGERPHNIDPGIVTFAPGALAK